MITNSIIGNGNQLGAQMTDYACLYYIARENNQDIVFWEELLNFRRGIRFYKEFDMQGLKIIPAKGIAKYIKFINDANSVKGGWKSQFNKIYKANLKSRLDDIIRNIDKKLHSDYVTIVGLQPGIHVANELMNLEQERNYDIVSGYGTIRDWGGYQTELIDQFKFKDQTIEQAEKCLVKMGLPSDKRIVSIHFRRTDYLLISSLNLQDDYYKRALKHFNQDNCVFLIFSDDIESCKSLSWLYDIDYRFVEGNTGIVDMCLMSMCDDNIIANSSFSFWGAILNRNEEKRVVCPHDFIGESDPEYMYINGNWYPDSWIAI